MYTSYLLCPYFTTIFKILALTYVKYICVCVFAYIKITNGQIVQSAPINTPLQDYIYSICYSISTPTPLYSQRGGFPHLHRDLVSCHKLS